MSSKVRYCDYCEKKYEYQRSTSKFCRASCRVGYHERGAWVERQLVDIVSDMEQVITWIDLYHRAMDYPKLLELSASVVVRASTLDQELLKASTMVAAFTFWLGAR